MLDALVELEIAAEVTGRTGRVARRLYGLKRLLPIRAETTAVQRRAQGRAARPAEAGPDRALRRTGGRSRTAGAPPDAEPVEPARLMPVSFDFDALDRLIAAADERTRGVRRLLDRVARGEKPFPPADRTG